MFAYFYFDFNNPEKQKYNNLICLLIKQLSWCFQTIPSALWELYSQKQNGTQKPMLGALLTLLKELCKPFMHTYIIWMLWCNGDQAGAHVQHSLKDWNLIIVFHWSTPLNINFKGSCKLLVCQRTF